MPRRLFVDEMIRPVDGEKLQELKIYTFGARVERLFHGLDRQGDHLANVWEVAEDGTLPPTPRASSLGVEGTDLSLPAATERAVAIARRLGSEFDHIRVDFMTTGERLWLGEMTVYNLAGNLTHGGTDPDSPGSRAWDLRRSGFLRDPPTEGVAGLLCESAQAAARRYTLAAARDKELNKGRGGIGDCCGRRSERSSMPARAGRSATVQTP